MFVAQEQNHEKPIPIKQIYDQEQLMILKGQIEELLKCNEVIILLCLTEKNRISKEWY